MPAAGWLGRKREPGNVSFTPRRKHATDCDGQVLDIQSRVTSFKFHQQGGPITQDNSTFDFFYFIFYLQLRPCGHPLKPALSSSTARGLYIGMEYM
jgi:hypothetical protein